MQSKQDTLMPEKNDNILENFKPYKNEKSILEEQKIEKDYKNLIGKSLDTESYIKNGLLRYISQVVLLANKLLLSSKEVRFNE